MSKSWNRPREFQVEVYVAGVWEPRGAPWLTAGGAANQKSLLQSQGLIARVVMLLPDRASDPYFPRTRCVVGSE